MWRIFAVEGTFIGGGAKLHDLKVDDGKEDVNLEIKGGELFPWKKIKGIYFHGGRKVEYCTSRERA